MTARAASFQDVRSAIEAGKIRVDHETGEIFVTRCQVDRVVVRARPVSWHLARGDVVRGPHQDRGYLRVSFTLNDERLRCLAHRVVWFASRGEIPDGFQVNHINGEKMDNRAINLEIVRPGENIRHAIQSGLLTPRSNFRGNGAKLSNAAVHEIRASSETQEVLATRYAVTQGQISRVRTRRSYRWLA